MITANAAVMVLWGSVMRRILFAALGALLLTFVFAESASAQRGWGYGGGWGVYRPGWRAGGLGWRTASGWGWRRPAVGYGWRYPWRPWAWGVGYGGYGYPYGYAYPSYAVGYGYVSPPCGACGLSALWYPAAAGWGW